MAIALVGSIGATTSGASPFQGSFGQATTAGNFLLGWSWQTGGSKIAVDQGWTLVFAVAVGLNLAYKANCGASETAPTYTGVGATFTLKLAEFSGVDTTSPLDQIATNTAGTSSPFTIGAPFADANSGSLLASVCGDGESKSGTTTLTNTYNNGATDLLGDNNGATSLALHYLFGYGITTGNSAGDQDQFASSNMNVINMYVRFASFKPAGAAAFQPRHPVTNFQDPGMLMKAWERARSGVWLPPKLWVPNPKRRPRIWVPEPVL
jgi:hypothetical protein